MLKLLHTADWHLGQLFYQYERIEEHEYFLNWLTDTIVQQEIDVLLISGDIFDHANPNIRSIRMWYHFLRNITDKRPALQIIIIAGNHDSASRLESPQPLLDESRIQIIGSVKRDFNGNIPPEQFCIPIYQQNLLKAYCLAIPFLRPGDFPNDENESLRYHQGVVKMYERVHQYAVNNLEKDIPLIAMGHLHALHAELSDEDNFERDIMGGVENVPASAFHPDILYVALGHIHKAQKINGQEYIRYSGSPIPMSFSEINYKHQVLTFEIENQKVQNIQSVQVPRLVELQKVPKKHLPLEQVLEEISFLPGICSTDAPPPYLEVRVLLNQPEPGLKFRIETALKDKYVRLARIDVQKLSAADTLTSASTSLKELHQLRPEDVFHRIYQKEFQQAPPEPLLQLFYQTCSEIDADESL